ncbi:hypothetical protein MAR_007262 [Mya arenaria]|uniref:Uncharacterized protein n=1 Tax=Mya arenaria TaxID=6604 RepID=A0ABY7DDU5_MYAAR|nr:hypothetical protein MAR_007262 [Mya arenaria]
MTIGAISARHDIWCHQCKVWHLVPSVQGMTIGAISAKHDIWCHQSKMGHLVPSVQGMTFGAISTRHNIWCHQSKMGHLVPSVQGMTFGAISTRHDIWCHQSKMGHLVPSVQGMTFGAISTRHNIWCHQSKMGHLVPSVQGMTFGAISTRHDIWCHQCKDFCRSGSMKELQILAELKISKSWTVKQSYQESQHFQVIIKQAQTKASKSLVDLMCPIADEAVIQTWIGHDLMVFISSHSTFLLVLYSRQIMYCNALSEENRSCNNCNTLLRKSFIKGQLIEVEIITIKSSTGCLREFKSE